MMVIDLYFGELPGNISPEVLDVAYRVMEKYGETLKGLQDR